jgi:hypothetical protein
VECAGSDGFVEKFCCFGANDAELGQGDSVEVGIGEIDLEIGEAVGTGRSTRANRIPR